MDELSYEVDKVDPKKTIQVSESWWWKPSQYSQGVFLKPDWELQS